MAKSSELFQLIQALSPAEKRHFKLYHQKQGTEDANKMIFIELFDDLNKLEEYDEEAFIKANQGKEYITYFSSNKTFLFGQILLACKDLRTNSPDQLFKELLEEAQFLRERMLYKSSYKRLNKAKQEAMRLEKHEELLVILRLERTILMEQRVDNSAKIKKLLDQIVEITAIIQNKYEYLRIKDILYLATKQQSKDRKKAHQKKIATLMESPLLQDVAKARCFDARHNFYFSHALYQQLSDNWALSMARHRDIIHLWMGNQEMQKNRAVDFRNVLNNFLAQCIELEDYALFPEVLKKMEEGPFQSEHERTEAKSNGLFMRIQFFLQRCAWADIGPILEEYARWKTRIEDKIPLSRLLSFYLLFAWYQLICCDYAEAIAWNEKILMHRKSTIREDIYNFASLFNLLLRYEAGQFEILERDHRSTWRHLRTSNALLPVETATLDCFKQLIPAPPRAEAAAIIQQLQDRLVDLKTEQGERYTVGIDILIDWAASKTTPATLKSHLETQWEAKKQTLIAQGKAQFGISPIDTTALYAK